MQKISDERHQTYLKSLEKLFPSEPERQAFLEKGWEELGGLSINAMREKIPYGIEVSEDIVAYLVGKRESGSGWERWFSNAVGGYFFPEEAQSWLDSPNELLGGRTNREIAASRDYKVLTEILWFLLLVNPARKDAPMFASPRRISALEEEMLLDEYFPESAGLAYRSKLAAEAAREKSRRYLLVVTLVILFVSGWVFFTWLNG